MQEKIIILTRFLKQVMATSKKYGMEPTYVYGQFNEVYHQLQLEKRKRQML